MLRWQFASWFMLLVVGAAAAAFGCRSTEDYLGYDRKDTLGSLACPNTYPNAYRDVLGHTQSEIDAKLAAAFDQLFHGASDTETIYFATGTDQATIKDILHNGEIRTEGLGLGMIVAVMLDHRDEFDRLWRYAVNKLQYPSGSQKGYFRSRCNVFESPLFLNTRECADPYGLEQFVTALLIARQRWSPNSSSPDYGTEVAHLFELMHHRSSNGSATNAGAAGASGLNSSGTAGASGSGGIANSFDDATKLIFDEPGSNPAAMVGTALLMPGYYAVWAQVTGDAFYADAAQAARGLLHGVANPTTGLLPVRATFDAMPLDGWGDFSAEAFRVLPNLVIDRMWGTSEPWQSAQIDAMLQFFLSQGIGVYGGAFTLDGKATATIGHLPELVLLNGVIASISNIPEQMQFLEAAWNVAIPTGLSRYYPGIIYLVSNLILGGQFRLCP
jgi:oligosaccharide reducing-end xylanase